ncbi:hypothetical protein Y032_0269g820 [Ancylostoma ceylanicum]|uniref:HAT C-terminal dimerisation domain-containing protein n=2 Tax=Ancylostoma ceylanicum TaxID=53326 RepID=A0A016S9W6_9BILA|nr:hypothetical protein Y032_0269g820 [Ancylostoma ceylanicum]
MGKYDKYFSECDGNYICKECDWITRKKEDSSTCSFRHHLKTKHPKSFKEMQQSDKELKENVKEKIKNKERSLKRSLKVVQLEESSAPKTSRKEEDTPSIVQVFKEYEPDGIRTVKIERAILQFICTATLPLSIVENRGFQNLMSILCPRFKIKSRTHFTRNSLVDLYNEYWTKVDEMLSGASHISFACDTWTSADNNHSILGLTAHFISKDMVPKFVVAAATPIKTRHTAENTKALLAKVLGTFNIGEEKIHMFVRDAATSMVATTNLLNMKSWDCFAHKIQLAVKDGLKILDSFENGSNSLIARLTSIVRKLKKSGVDKESFKEYQTLCDVPNRMLVKGIEVRWNSMYYMISRFLEVKKPLELFLLDHHKYPMLDSCDWDMMKKIAEVLKPLAMAIESVQNRYFSPISVVIPLYRVLLKKLEEGGSLIHVKRAIRTGLISRMRDYEENEELVMATIVDPRYKDAYFTTNRRELLVKKMEEIIISLRQPEPSPVHEESPEKDPENPFFSFWQSDLGRCTPSPNPLAIDARTKAMAEADEYLAQKPSFSIDPFEYWRSDINASKFPHIKMLACKYLSAPATSAECERLFSTAGLIVSDLRTSLTVENLEKLLFLHHNILILGF